jgi:hypothetical protein
MNGGTCINLGNGLYTCTCSPAFTGNKKILLKDFLKSFFVCRSKL